jgi:hypothetical protein
MSQDAGDEWFNGNADKAKVKTKAKAKAKAKPKAQEVQMQLLVDLQQQLKELQDSRSSPATPR